MIIYSLSSHHDDVDGDGNDDGDDDYNGYESWQLALKTPPIMMIMTKDVNNDNDLNNDN